MLSRSLLTKGFLGRSTPMMAAASSRGVYTAENRPKVFINEHTKVLCQGMTGKHVSYPESTANSACLRNGKSCAKCPQRVSPSAFS